MHQPIEIPASFEEDAEAMRRIIMGAFCGMPHERQLPPMIMLPPRGWEPNYWGAL